MNIPTVEELNELPAEQVAALILNCLNTSDLTFMYMLFEKSTLSDIIGTCGALVVNSEPSILSEEDSDKMSQIMRDISEYIG